MEWVAALPRVHDGDPQDGDAAARTVLRTTDLEEARVFCRRRYYGPLEVRPAAGLAGFAFTADVARIGPLTVGEVGYGVEMDVGIDPGTAYHVLAPLTGTIRARHRGGTSTADPGRAVVLQPDGDIALRWSADCRVISVKVDRLALERELGPPPPGAGQVPAPGLTFGLTGGAGRSWLGLIRLIHAELREPDGLRTLPALLRRWRELAIAGLAHAVEEAGAGLPADPRSARRPRTVKRALDAMHAEPGRAFTTHDLAAISGVGVRVLQESFRRHLGVSPLTYLRRLRLEGVHADLIRGEDQDRSVSEVAHRWGFTHLGRFAGAYRDHYGIAPSETLRNRA